MIWVILVVIIGVIAICYKTEKSADGEEVEVIGNIHEEKINV